MQRRLNLRNVSLRTTVVALAAALVMLVGVTQAQQGSDSKVKEVKAAVVGKVEVKAEKERGKDVKVAYVKVTSATDAHGEAMEKLQDASLKVVGPKSGDVVKLAGKQVSVAGKIRDGKDIHVDAVAMKSDEEGSDTKEPRKPKKDGPDEGSDTK